MEDEPSLRPDFKNIVEILEKIYQNNIEFKSEEFEQYKNYLNKEEKLEIIESNKQIKQFKEDADKGDPFSMYLYGKSKYEGDKCDMDKELGIKYLSSAAILKSKEAIYYFEVIEKERLLLNTKKDNLMDENSNSLDESSSQKSEYSKIKEKIPEERNNHYEVNMKFEPLCEDIFFNLEQNEEVISKVIENVNNNY